MDCSARINKNCFFISWVIWSVLVLIIWNNDLIMCFSYIRTWFYFIVLCEFMWKLSQLQALVLNLNFSNKLLLIYSSLKLCKIMSNQWCKFSPVWTCEICSLNKYDLMLLLKKCENKLYWGLGLLMRACIVRANLGR